MRALQDIRERQRQRTVKNSISSLRQPSLIAQQKGRLSTVSMMRLAIRRLHLSELLVYRWDGWHLRQICWRKTGRLQRKSWKGEIDESNVITANGR